MDESDIGQLRRAAAAALLCLREPTSAQVFQGNAGKIRFDIEYRSAIKHVHSTNMQTGSFTAQKFDDSQADRIWAPRRTRGEYAMRPRVRGWCGHQIVTGDAVEHPQDIEMRETLNVGETWFVDGQDF